MSEGNRLPRLHPDELAPDQMDLYRAFVEGPRQGQASYFPVTNAEGLLSGPYRAMLLSASAGRHMERLGRAIRYELGLPSRARELTILTVAAHMESEVEWQAHEALALAEGVPEATVESLRSEDPMLVDQTDAAVHAFVSQLLADHSVDRVAFEAVHDRFGSDGLFDLIATTGYYQTIAHINNAFDLRPATPAGGSARPLH